MSLQDCTVDFRGKRHQLYPDIILVVVAVLRDPQNEEIGRLKGWLIDRLHEVPTYFEQIRSEEQGQSAISAYRLLFDKWGKIRPWLLNNNYLKGLGTWGEELNKGRLLYVGDFFLKQRGRATPSAWKLLGSPYLGPQDFAYTHLDPQLDPDRAELFTKHRFSRVGLGPVFAHSKDPFHSSGRLPVAKDVVPAPYVHQPTCGSSATEQEHVDRVSRERHLADFHPVHSVLAKATDYTDEQLDKIIHDLCNDQPSLVHEQDDEGRTPIFTAVFMRSVQAVRTLLLLDAAQDLDRRDNITNRTPLEYCSETMMFKKESQEMKGVFTGNAERSLRMIWLMKRALGSPGLVESEEVYVKAQRWDCTCGKCLDGWYSQRMQWALELEALPIVGGAERPELPASCFDGQWFLPFRVTYEDVSLDHLPYYLRIRLSKEIYKGYRACLEAISKVLCNISDDDFPTPDLPPFRMRPICKNNYDFELVRSRLCDGFSPGRWGPYTAEELVRDINLVPQMEDESSEVPRRKLYDRARLPKETMTAIQAVYVRGHEERPEPKPHTVFRIEIQAHVRSWQIWRRYSEFADLHTELSKSAGAPPPAPLPPKHAFAMLRSRNNEALLEERRLGLEAYLRAIVSAREDVWREAFAFRDFLGIPVGKQLGSGELGGPTQFTSSSWLDEHMDLLTRVRDIRADINRRDALSDHGDVGGSHTA
ncbi:hypothetical protein EVG20_g8897, partial [Dentipellis fragilis]